MSTPSSRPQHTVDSGAGGIVTRPRRRTSALVRKVPEITIYFWIVKLLTTAMGESTSDYLVYHINPYIAVALGGLGLAAALALQLTAPRYVAWVYWLTALMVAVFGTMAADALHIQLGIPYLVSTSFFALALVVVFLLWYAREHTLSIHSICTPSRELFYWATAIATFALGTAAGDMTAVTLGLGYFASGVLFGVLIVVPAVAYWMFGLNEVPAFWFAYIVTRPLGASIADWLGKPLSARGLDFGDGPVSLVLALLIAGFVGYLTVTRKDIAGEQRSLEPGTIYSATS